MIDYSFTSFAPSLFLQPFLAASSFLSPSRLQIQMLVTSDERQRVLLPHSSIHCVGSRTPQFLLLSIDPGRSSGKSNEGSEDWISNLGNEVGGSWHLCLLACLRAGI